jgi:hypothetical protein
MIGELNALEFILSRPREARIRDDFEGLQLELTGYT